jgi:hypothetical protein
MLNRCLREEFQIERGGGAFAENDDNNGYLVFRTGTIQNSWIRAFRSGIPVDFANKINFRFKGNLLGDRSILTRVGVGMEGPNDNTNISAKFGIEGYDDDGTRSFYNLVTSDGICRRTFATPLSIRETNPKCYALTLEPGVSCKLEYANTLTISTCNIPSYGMVNEGMTFGIKTLDDTEKNMSLVSAALRINQR